MNLSETDILLTLEEKYPDQSKVITQLFQRDQHFREICEDYILCLYSMNKIIVTNEIHSRILQEYKAALTELELEFLEYMNNNTPR